MYAKIPFTSNWTEAQVLSVIASLLSGTTNPTALPAGITASASITNTVPHGWTLVRQSAGSYLVASSPITARTNKSKFVAISTATNILQLVLGDASANTNTITVNGTTVATTTNICDSSVVAKTGYVMLHVSITPSHMLFMLERLTGASLTSAGTNGLIAGVVDQITSDTLYSDAGPLMPVVLAKDWTQSSGSALIMEPTTLSYTNGIAPVVGSYVAQAYFVFRGAQSQTITLPDSGKQWRSGASTSAQIYEVGFASTSSESETSKLADIYATSTAFAGSLIENTINGKTYVSWTTTAGNTLLVAKE